MNQQESLYLHDVTVLLKESVDLLENFFAVARIEEMVCASFQGETVSG